MKVNDTITKDVDKFIYLGNSGGNINGKLKITYKIVTNSATLF